MVQKQLLRKNKTTASVVATNLKLYYEKLTELKDELPNDTVFNKNDERTWNNYLVFLNFIDQLTPWETIVLTMFIKKAKADPKFSRIELLKDLTILRVNQNEFDILEKGLGTFNLAVIGSNFIECVNSIKSYIPYMGDSIAFYNSPVKTIKVNINIGQKDDGSGNFQDTEDTRDRIKRIIHWINQFYSGGGPSDPIEWVEELPSYDSRIRFSIGEEGNERIYFYKNTDFTCVLAIRPYNIMLTITISG